MQQNEGNNTAAQASADFCDLDMICESAARIGFELAELPCDEQSPVVSEGIVVRLPVAADGKCSSCAMKLRRAKDLQDIAFCPKCWKFYSTAAGDAVRWLLSERGMANFVGRKIALGWAQPAGAVFHLGEVNQRDLYFAIRPPSQFFSAHNNKNVSLVVGNSAAEIPNGWNGQLAFFNELFYYHKNELRVAPNICDRILPKARAGLRRGKNRVIHERRDLWLRFLVWLFLKPYDPKCFFRGTIRPSVVCDWFKRNIPGVPTSRKTYKRDQDQFRTYHDNPGERDFREPALIMLMKKVSDPMFTRRKEMAETITNILVQLKEDEQKFGHAVEIPKCAWQYTGDKSGTRELVATTPESIPDFDFE